MNYQDMLARLGVGSAHPGGFAATLDLLSHFPIKRGSQFLEIGCGTGRTACYLAKKGYNVTAIDIRPTMLEKARKRANSERVPVHFQEGDACSLPFEDRQFDVIFVESVTVFVEAKRAISEYYRVLREDGKLFDREMTAILRHPRKVKEAIYKLYGVKKVPSFDEWKDYLSHANFQDVGIWKPSSVPSNISMADEWTQPDSFQQMDDDVYKDPRIKEMIERNTKVMTRYQEYLGYGVLLGTKK